MLKKIILIGIIVVIINTATLQDERNTYSDCITTCTDDYKTALDNTSAANPSRDPEGINFVTYMKCTKNTEYDPVQWEIELKPDWSDYYETATEAREADPPYVVQQSNFCDKEDLIPPTHAYEYIDYIEQCDIACGFDPDNNPGYLNGYSEPGVMVFGQLRTCKDACKITAETNLQTIYKQSYDNLEECQDTCLKTSDAKYNFYERTMRDMWRDKINNCMESYTDVFSNLDNDELRDDRKIAPTFKCVEYQYALQNQYRDQSTKFNQAFWDNRQSCENYCIEYEQQNEDKTNECYEEWYTCDKNCFDTYYSVNNFNSDVITTNFDVYSSLLKFNILGLIFILGSLIMI